MSHLGNRKETIPEAISHSVLTWEIYVQIDCVNNENRKPKYPQVNRLKNRKKRTKLNEKQNIRSLNKYRRGKPKSTHSTKVTYLPSVCKPLRLCFFSSSSLSFGLELQLYPLKWSAVYLQIRCHALTTFKMCAFEL